MSVISMISRKICDNIHILHDFEGDIPEYFPEVAEKPRSVTSPDAEGRG
jgi:hypothetical protein